MSTDVAWIDTTTAKRRQFQPVYGYGEYSRDRDDGIWFWNETGTECCGPYASLEKAKEGYDMYRKWVISNTEWSD